MPLSDMVLEPEWFKAETQMTYQAFRQADMHNNDKGGSLRFAYRLEDESNTQTSQGWDRLYQYWKY